MTPQELLDSLHISNDQIHPVLKLKDALNAFEQSLYGERDLATRDALREDSEDCIELIAKFLGKPTQEAQDAVLGLLGISADELVFSRTTSAMIVALSCLLRQNLENRQDNPRR